MPEALRALQGDLSVRPFQTPVLVLQDRRQEGIKGHIAIPSDHRGGYFQGWKKTVYFGIIY